MPVAGRGEDVVHSEGDLLYVGVTVGSNVLGPDPAFPLCDTAPRDVVIDIGAPIAGRDVITQAPLTRWRSTTDGEFERCELPRCDPGTGSAPLPATCDDATLADAV
jgi:hypothetical protein